MKRRTLLIVLFGLLLVLLLLVILALSDMRPVLVPAAVQVPLGVYPRDFQVVDLQGGRHAEWFVQMQAGGLLNQVRWTAANEDGDIAVYLPYDVSGLRIGLWATDYNRKVVAAIGAGTHFVVHMSDGSLRRYVFASRQQPDRNDVQALVNTGDGLLLSLIREPFSYRTVIRANQMVTAESTGVRAAKTATLPVQ